VAISIKMNQTTTPDSPKENIKWRNSVQAQILLQDLEEGILPLDNYEHSARDAWNDCYKKMDEFKDVPFQQFSDRLRDHRKQVQKRVNRSINDEVARIHDRHIYPRQNRNSRGDLVFDMSPAKMILREDVINGIHETMTPSELQGLRTEYEGFKSDVFKRRIYQEVRLQKYYNYRDNQREKKKTELDEAREEFRRENR
jgi:hypothetical protein